MYVINQSGNCQVFKEDPVP